MQDLRCTCGRLLGKGDGGVVEIKCHRCGVLNGFVDGKRRESHKMAEMDMVYIVTQGGFSDRSIRAVFVDKALAEAHAEEVGGDVEEWTVRTRKPVWVVKHIACVGYDGSELNYSTQEWFDYGDELRGEGETKDFGRYIWAASFGGKGEALKVARDKLAQMKAAQTKT